MDLQRSLCREKIQWFRELLPVLKSPSCKTYEHKLGVVHHGFPAHGDRTTLTHWPSGRHPDATSCMMDMNDLQFNSSKLPIQMGESR